MPGDAAVAVIVRGRADMVHDVVVRWLESSGIQVVASSGDVRGGIPVVQIVIEPDAIDRDAMQTAQVPVVLLDIDPLDDTAVLEDALRGADSVLPLDVDLTALVDTVRTVALGGSVLTPRQVRLVLEVARNGHGLNGRTIHLTTREREILESVERGESVKQTALALGVTPKTIENLQHRLFLKLAVRNRAQAVAAAHALGLLR